MSKFKIFILATAGLLAAVTSTVWWVERPKRTRMEFFGHLYHERYDEAALMLSAPCDLKLAADGGITVVDQKGNTTAVSATKLPFLVSGGNARRPGVHTMTALGESTNGILASPPVIIHLSVEDGKVSIEKVDS